MKKIIVLLIIFMLFSCSNNNQNKIKNIDAVKQGSISVDNSVITFESFDNNGGENLRKLIYSNFNNLVIEAGDNINFIDGLNNFNGNELLIHVNKNIFGLDLLKKIKGAKGKILSFEILSDNDTVITISDEEAKIYDELNFENMDIVLSVGNGIGTITCSENAKKVLKNNCNN